jgi:hypothetical protein
VRDRDRQVRRVFSVAADRGPEVRDKKRFYCPNPAAESAGPLWLSVAAGTVAKGDDDGASRNLLHRVRITRAASLRSRCSFSQYFKRLLPLTGKAHASCRTSSCVRQTLAFGGLPCRESGLDRLAIA